MANNRRNNQAIWLLGSMCEKIQDCILPTRRQVLGRFLYLHLHNKNIIQESALLTSQEIINFWLLRKIPCREKRNVVVCVKKLHKYWLNLRKDKNKTTVRATEKRNNFTSQLDNLFDIVSMTNNSHSRLTESDESLLNSLRLNKRLSSVMIKDSEIDNTKEVIEETSIIVMSKLSLSNSSLSKRKKQKREFSQLNENVELYAEDDYDEDANPVTGPSFSIQKKRKMNIMSDDVCAVLDRSKVSNRSAVYILAATCKALQCDIRDINLSAETVRRSRQNYRHHTMQDVKNSLPTAASLVVHWDSKMLKSLKSKDLVDRLAVLVSGKGNIKLLGIPIIESGTGAAQAQAVYELILEWNIADRVKAMCFDTTASNSGPMSGTCTLLENKLGKSLLALPCRHHILELPLSAVFNFLFGASNGPEIKLFQRFQKAWSTIDKSQYESGLQDSNLSYLITPLREDLVIFIQNQMKMFQPRDDYKELLQLALLFMGENSIKPVNIRAPGAVHRARWMAKTIYCLKIYLFRKQFPITKSELAALRQFNIFTVGIYLKNWYTCQNATLAPVNDLQLMKDLLEYKTVNTKVSEIAFATMSRHTWYLSEKLIALAFFDSSVPVEIKRAMVSSLTKEGSRNPLRRIIVDKTTIANQELDNFVTKNTMEFFKMMQIPDDFLKQDLIFWSDIDDYLNARSILQQLNVVNDVAERGVALIEEYNSILTTQEDQKQYLLQVVEKNRKEVPNPKKNTIIQAFS
ncbi:hypothetical protein ALC62_02431 [Cyphomyrmex costatus]|uniref:Uncharacterized protein n=1 Tax=Cyphomyrmex costatus TaxID=456900 RepID=A0A151IND4_9HYME|nr:hypothetical protein ALC62_02431 [Cyphomyrmex costatus]